jgi:orotidine-5'-phosphate decarboxylase
MLEPRERLIFALDVPDDKMAIDLVNELRDEVGLFKVGLELFLAEGPQILQDVVNEAGSPDRVFLDLKLYDIPATVLGAIKTILHGIALITVPSDLGPAGLKKIVDSVGSVFKILAVTLLTSITGEDLKALGLAPRFAKDPVKLVVHKARLAQEAGCHGVVCSGREVKAVKEACGSGFLAVCPGIRPAWAAVAGDDQRRIVTPQEAIANGADYIVVGRPIRDAEKRAAAASLIVKEIAAGLKG